MENDVYLMIRDEFLHGSDEKQAFLNICKKRDLEMPLESTASNWINRLRDHDEALEEEIEELHYDLLCSITGQYSKFKYAMFYSDYWEKGNEAIVQDRAIIGIDRKMFFMLYDSFNEESESRPLQTTVDRSSLFLFYISALMMIDDQRALLTVYKHGGEHLLLLYFDFEQLKWSILDDVILNFFSDQIILDSVDSSQLLVQGQNEDGDSTIMYKGRVTDDKIYVDTQEIEPELEVKLGGCKLMGDRFSAFHRTRGDRNNWKFVEYDISSNLARKLNEWSPSDFPKSLNFYNTSEYLWANNKMYAACCVGSNFSIVVFNSDARMWSTTKFIGAGRVAAISIDDEQVLTISASHYLDDSRNYPLEQQK